MGTTDEVEWLAGMFTIWFVDTYINHILAQSDSLVLAKDSVTQLPLPWIPWPLFHGL